MNKGFGVRNNWICPKCQHRNSTRKNQCQGTNKLTQKDCGYSRKNKGT